MTNDYTNARTCLPPELLAEVRKYCPGGMLWVPPVQRRHGPKRRIVTEMLKTGLSGAEIRKLIEVSPCYLRRLIHEIRSAENK